MRNYLGRVRHCASATVPLDVQRSAGCRVPIGHGIEQRSATSDQDSPWNSATPDDGLARRLARRLARGLQPRGPLREHVRAGQVDVGCGAHHDFGFGAGARVGRK